MRIDLVVLLGLVTLTICAARPAPQDDAEYDDAEPAPPPKKAAARAPLVGRRNPLAAKNNKAASTTTTTAAPLEEEEEAVVEGDYEDEVQPETSSTTEAPKKIIRGGIVRPFRSNEDLLNSLKKRREQAVTNKHSKPIKTESDQPAAEPEKAPKETSKSTRNNNSSGGRRNRFSKEKPEGAPEEGSSTAAPARAGRRFNSRS